jgi:hypothetical protein
MITLQDIGIISSIPIALAGLGISLFNLWHTFFWTPKPQFVCTDWLAVHETKNGMPFVSFAVHVTVINHGGKPIEVKDILLVAHFPQYGAWQFNPTELIDYAEYLRSRRYSITLPLPLPIVIPERGSFDYGYPIKLMPLQKEDVGVKPSIGEANTYLYALIDRFGWLKVGEQSFSADDMAQMNTAAFLLVTPTAIVKSREEFHKNLINLLNSNFK